VGGLGQEEVERGGAGIHSSQHNYQLDIKKEKRKKEECHRGSSRKCRTQRGGGGATQRAEC